MEQIEQENLAWFDQLAETIDTMTGLINTAPPGNHGFPSLIMIPQLPQCTSAL
jgi:hypothetical protein